MQPQISQNDPAAYPISKSPLGPGHTGMILSFLLTKRFSRKEYMGKHTLLGKNLEKPPVSPDLKKTIYIYMINKIF